MLKSVAAATAALAIAGSSIVWAQQRFGGPGDYGDSPRFEQHYRPSIEDVKAFADARIAALKAGLELTPDQEKNWPPFEQALRDLVKLRVERIEARQAREAAGAQQQPADPFARLQRRADAMSQLSAALKHLGATGEPLYQSLNDAQKRRFTVLAHILRPHWMAGRGSWHHGHGMMGRDWDHGGMHGMMSPDSDDDESGMTGPDGHQDSDNL